MSIFPIRYNQSLGITLSIGIPVKNNNGSDALNLTEWSIRDGNVKRNPGSDKVCCKKK